MAACAPASRRLRVRTRGGTVAREQCGPPCADRTGRARLSAATRGAHPRAARPRAARVLSVTRGAPRGPAPARARPGQPHQPATPSVPAPAVGDRVSIARRDVSGWVTGRARLHLHTHGRTARCEPRLGLGTAATHPLLRTPTSRQRWRLRRGRGYGLAVALVGAGILGLELSSGGGWALILLGGWVATLASQRAYAR